MGGEDRSLDHFPGFLNLEASPSKKKKIRTAPGSLGTLFVYLSTYSMIQSSADYVDNLNTELIGVFPGT